MKSLTAFMHPFEEKIIKAPLPKRFGDDLMEIRTLPPQVLKKLRGDCKDTKIAVDDKGNPYINGGEVVHEVIYDTEKAVRLIVAEALVYPDLKDAGLMAKLDCIDITEMLDRVFHEPGEVEHVISMVYAVINDNADAETLIKKAKKDLPQ
ncbi:MAG: hypothetical protein LBT21_06275 [Oscillospiraceae bacterium]|jgi:hypothetical protein|nr:hypothetical protein [Oscillospiraceae bacterium]